MSVEREAPIEREAPTNRAIGVDVGGTKVLAGIVEFDSAMRPSLKKSIKSGVDKSPEALVRQITQMTAELDSNRELAVGVGLPGFVDHAGIARAAPNLSYLIDVDILTPLRSSVGVAVTIDNDANAAAAGIAATDAVGLRNVLVATLGTGIGGGLIVDGQLYRGHRGFAGEIGHLIVEAGGLLCPCGQRGCWEGYGSGAALGRHGAAIAKQRPNGSLASFAKAGTGNESSATENTVSSPMVVALAVSGDSEAIEALDRWANYVAVGLVSLNSILDPARIVLGGGIIEEVDVVFGAISTKVNQLIGSIGPDAIDVVPTTLGPEAGAIGAAVLAVKL